MNTKPKRAILIAGPTASGKSEVAIEIAKTLDGIIINADSMQVYEDLALITARPSKDVIQNIPHVLYGTVKADRPFSVADWLALAKKETELAWANGKTAVFTGGTGLYFKALLQGLADVPEIPVDVRDKLRSRLEKEGIESLYKELQIKDPGMAPHLKAGDRQRILRALEVFTATGKSLSDWQEQKQESILEGAQVLGITLELEREVLEQRIRNRFHEMVAKGALKEAKAFIAKTIDPTQPASKALGLRPLVKHIEGDITLDEAIDLAVTESRQYAKRQRTWFRNQFPDWHQVEAGRDAPKTILSLAKDALKG